MSGLGTLVCWLWTLVAFLHALSPGYLSLADLVSTPRLDIHCLWKVLSAPQFCLHLESEGKVLRKEAGVGGVASGWYPLSCQGAI